ncbi:MAG: amidohydrolase family protein [Verrucomicrobiota bacterium]
MWVPKWQRDRDRGVDSPIPTQVVSNEEFIPRKQSAQQKQWEHLIGELAAEKSKKLGMDRGDFMRSSMGMATAFLAGNMVFGPYWDVSAAETEDAAAGAEKWPKGEYFVFDVQTHFTDGFSIGSRGSEFLRNMGIKLDQGKEAYGFQNFVKEIFFDSETSMAVISGVPGREVDKNKAGKILEGRDRRGGVLPSWLMSRSKKQLNDLAECKRVLCQGNCAPNHYWDRKTNAPDKSALLEQVEREVKTYGIDSWKWYCHTDPGKSGNGFRLDDEKLAYPFYERSKELGLKVFSVHKGFASQSRTLGHFAHPGDVEKAAKDHPDLTFIIYHSAMKHGTWEPQFKDPKNFDPESGDFAWHDALMKIKERNPDMNNVYCEIGTSFGTLAILHPVMCMHLLGKNIKYYGADHVIWGTDCLWWGSPQWVIDAFKRFQISDEICEQFGYAKLTKEDKAKIFGLNGAKVYGIDLEKQLKAFPGDALTKFKSAYIEHGGQPDNAAHGWVKV